MTTPSERKKVVIVGAGMGGLSAAVALSSRKDLAITVVEALNHPGGKVAWQEVDGVRFDTGPSLFTLPQIPASLFDGCGRSLDTEITLFRAQPHFQYRFGDGTILNIGPSSEENTEEVGRRLGPSAAAEFDDFLNYCRRIWEAAAPHFIMGEAPSMLTPFKMGLSAIRAFRDIDSTNTMLQAIDGRLNNPHLRDLFLRYATFNGSDPRRAPATLNCIAWVDLGLGGWGIKGGMGQLAIAMERVASLGGVEFVFDARLRSIEYDGSQFSLHTGAHRFLADAVVVNADVRHLVEDLWATPADHGFKISNTLSMSAWTAIIRSRRRPIEERPPHMVLFPRRDYLREFVDIFDGKIPPQEPTLYVCAQEKAHRLTGWADEEPLFVMINTPALADPGKQPPVDWPAFEERILERLRQTDLIDSQDSIIWRRTPEDLARQFPGTQGSLYGPASNDRFAAFRRAPNRAPKIAGLYLATGSAHPGGGVPLCIQSGRQAAAELLEDLGLC